MVSSFVRRARAAATIAGLVTVGLPSAALAAAPPDVAAGSSEVRGTETVETARVAPAVASAVDASTRRSWRFAGAPLGPVAPGASFGSPALFASGERPSLSVVASSRGQVLDVRSWRGLRPGQPV
ncbi:MAG: hypothetical protein ACRCZP_02900, partial [Phycicoccus sp.]